jgi:tRNA uridine 5-carboxymethylaminomethyl modification enzyme
MYVNGLSTSLPAEVQLEFLRSVPGLESVEMTRPGYAIEYDYFPPTQLTSTLELRALPGLFLAGQVNGTTGYEEAAGQGAIAGINAAARAGHGEPVVLGREVAFIGVLIDDLVSRGVDEPYRLFTSRSEYRLLLRQDNALRRLLPVAERSGLLDSAELRRAEQRLRREDEIMLEAEITQLDAETANVVLQASGSTPVNETQRVVDLARRPGVPVERLLEAAGVVVEEDESRWADIELKYAGYLAREQANARRLAGMNEFVLPDGIVYRDILTLSYEAREKLTQVRPQSLGQASRVPGVSPSDLQNLLAEVLRLGGRGTGVTGRFGAG